MVVHVPAPVDGSYDIWRTSFCLEKNPSYILAYYAERQQLDSTEEQYDTYQSGISGHRVAVNNVFTRT